MGGHERYVALLFVDLVGSTPLVASERPGEVVELLNQFFHVVAMSSIGTADSLINSKAMRRWRFSARRCSTRMDPAPH